MRNLKYNFFFLIKDFRDADRSLSIFQDNLNISLERKYQIVNKENAAEKLCGIKMPLNYPFFAIDNYKVLGEIEERFGQKFVFDTLFHKIQGSLPIFKPESVKYNDLIIY